MIRDLKKLNEGRYCFDFRFDEGVRIRERASAQLCNSTSTEQTTASQESSSWQRSQELRVKNATKKGYQIVKPGSAFNVAYPESDTRRARVVDDGKIAPTLETSPNIGCAEWDGKEIRVRKLTPRECFRLQGFPDEYFERAAAVNSDTQLYKQAGNSVTVNVIYEFAKRFKFDDGV